MNKQEMNGIWRLIGTYRPGDQRLKNDQLLKAWYIALKPYGAEETTGAVVEHFRRHTYFPKPAEIISLLPQETNGARYAPLGPSAQASLEALQEWQAEWDEELKRLGLPTFREAVAAGMALSDWRKMLKEAGVWD